MPGFFNRIFKSTKKQEYNTYHRGSFRPNETFTEGASILKGSMRRRDMYPDEPLINPAAPYHYDIKPQRHRGPRSLPPQMMNEYSPNESPSSSTDIQAERSFQSEVQHRRKKSKYTALSPPHHQPQHSRSHHDARRRRIREYENSDSENTPYNEYELISAFGKINSYKTKLGMAIAEKRRLEFKTKEYEDKYNEIKRSKNKLVDEVNDLRRENLFLRTEVMKLETELRLYQSNYFNCNQPPPFMFQSQPPPPQRMYSFRTPSTSQRIQLNNTNTGNSTLVGSASGGFRPPPVMGDGSGESLAFPGTRVADMPLTEEMQDEVKVFRRNEESSPSRPPTNCISRQSFELSSTSMKTSAQSTPESKNEKTPTVTQKTQTEDSKLIQFEKLIITQNNIKPDVSPAKGNLKKSLSSSNIRTS